MPDDLSPRIDTELFVLTAENRTEASGSRIVFYGISPLGPVRVSAAFEPFLFVDAHAVIPSGSGATVAPEPYRSLTLEPLKKLSFRTSAAADEACAMFKNSGARVHESDVRPRDRFFMERYINCGVSISGAVQRRGKLLVFDEPKITPARYTPRFTVCSLDIETSISNGSVLSIGAHLTGEGIDERIVFMRGTPEETEGFPLRFVPDERTLFLEFMKWFELADPDLIIGWNVIGFDLSVLRKRADVAGVEFRIGRERRDVLINEAAGRFSRAIIPGRIVLDGPQLLRMSFHSFESYSLEFVSNAVLNRGKLIGPSGNKAWEIERLFERDKRALAEYNLEDCVLVTEIFKRLELIELTVRRSQLSGRPLDQVGMSTKSFDHFILPRLHAAGFAAPDLDDIGEVTASGGGYVMSPEAGIYDDVLGLDFQSLYPTIIRTFSIDPLSRAQREIDPVRTPSGHAFSRTHAILPDFIAELMSERKCAKREKNAPLSQAIKILMNSFYGVMGSPGCRLYHPDLPDAITGTGQWLLTESKRWLEARGHVVIYGDTDSLFVKTGTAASGEEVAAALTEEWRARLGREFGVTSHLVLEFKKFYKKFLVPSLRGSEGGAKKRYAGLVLEDGREELEFVGLEVVRSDSTRLARDFQVALYTKVFRGEPLQEWLRGFIDEIRAGRHDDKLVYRKRLHKRPHEYGKSPPPYVRAALMLEKPGRDVRYVMTVNGPVPIELEPRNPDYKHYIDKQIQPVADSVLTLLSTSFDDLTKPRQMKLF